MSVIYDVSILAIFKNEESFLLEWLDHYFNRNIDHIYLLNDNSNDHSLDIINEYSNKKNITLLHTNEEDSRYNQVWRQRYLYNKYYTYILEQTKWIGIFDLDEFCYATNELNFKKVLHEYENNDSILQLIIDWYWFGSNNYIEQPANIISSFNKRGKELAKIISYNNDYIKNIYDPNWCCKSFAKTNYIRYLSHHFNININSVSDTLLPNDIGNYNLSNNNTMFINHYIGSKNYYFNNKVSRGSCNRIMSIANNKAKLYEYLNLNDVEDNRLKDQKDSRIKN